MIFEYKVRAKHILGFKEFKLYATTDIEEFFNRNNIDYVRNMTDTVEHRLLREIERLNNIISEANKILSDILVIKDREHKGRYRPIKNTSSQDVYKAIIMLNELFETPYRENYGLLDKYGIDMLDDILNGK